MVPLGRDGAGQLVQIFVRGRHDRHVSVRAYPVQKSLAVGVQQPELAQRRGRVV